jgi:hypothetical protein
MNAQLYSIYNLNSEIPLTGANKNWIAIKVMERNISMSKVARSLNVPKMQVCRWVQNVRLGRTNFESRGRPPALDKLAEDNVAQLCRDEPHTNEYLIRWIVDEEYRATCVRRHPETDYDAFGNLSTRSKKRYFKKHGIVDESMFHFGDEGIY